MLICISNFMMNDTEALKTALEGREDGFKAIFANHAAFLFTHALRILKNDQTAEDAVQETFLSAFKALASFKGESQLRTWLYRILYNNALKSIRSNAQAGETESSFENIRASATDPTRRLEVSQILDQLPPRDRTVLILVYWDDLPLKEAALILGTSENNAKIILFRARKRFSEIWHNSQGKEISNEM